MKTNFLLALAVVSLSMGCQSIVGIEDTILSADSSTGETAGSDAGTDTATTPEVGTDASLDTATDVSVPETAPVCAKAAKRCAGNLTQICNDSGSGWVDGMTCPFLCIDGACSGGCKPNNEQCKGDARTPQTCDSSGAWIDGATCPYVCTAGACAGSCIPGSKVCEGKVPVSCDNSGNKQLGAACPVLCDKGVCATSCTASTKQCSGLVPQTCVGGSWSDAAACPFACKDGACVGTCAPGTKRCTALTPETCDANGAWVSAPAACTFGCNLGECTGCTLDAQCAAKFPTTPACNIATGTCAVCAPGTKRCTNGVPQECGPTGWVDKTACQYVCQDGACAGECVPNSTRCSGRDSQKCDASGQWQTTQTCNVCTGAGSCTGVCVPQDMQCSGKTPQTCGANGQWVDGTVCPVACVGQGTCSSSCMNNADCATHPPNVVCDNTTGLCVECLTNNACGGCGDLNGMPGQRCTNGVPDPNGCGTLRCALDKRSLICDGESAKNACGGCEPLAFSPGSECYASAPLSCGKYVCQGLDALDCMGSSEPNACGGCSGATTGTVRPDTSCGAGLCWTCTGLDVTCTKPVNSCGGCVDLPGKPDDPCGQSGGCGRFRCNGPDQLYCDNDVIGCGSCDAGNSYGCGSLAECCKGTCVPGQSCP